MVEADSAPVAGPNKWLFLNDQPVGAAWALDFYPGARWPMLTLPDGSQPVAVLVLALGFRGHVYLAWSAEQVVAGGRERAELTAPPEFTRSIHALVEAGWLAPEKAAAQRRSLALALGPRRAALLKADHRRKPAERPTRAFIE